MLFFWDLVPLNKNQNKRCLSPCFICVDVTYSINISFDGCLPAVHLIAEFQTNTFFFKGLTGIIENFELKTYDVTQVSPGFKHKQCNMNFKNVKFYL